MNYWQLRNRFYDLACFNVHQVYAWEPQFEKNNLTRWTAQNLLVKLRNSWYCFPEYLKMPNFQYFISNKMVSPSYISLHSALAFYGIIPEAVVQTTAITSLKTTAYDNRAGSFTYQKILPRLLFGYEQKPFINHHFLFFATPEKAMLDLLYLYPMYNSEQEISELRFDEEYMHEDLNLNRLLEYTERFQSKIVSNRINLLIKTYDLC